MMTLSFINGVACLRFLCTQCIVHTMQTISSAGHKWSKRRGFIPRDYCQMQWCWKITTVIDSMRSSTDKAPFTLCAHCPLTTCAGIAPAYMVNLSINTHYPTKPKRESFWSPFRWYMSAIAFICCMKQQSPLRYSIKLNAVKSMYRTVHIFFQR